MFIASQKKKTKKKNNKNHVSFVMIMYNLLISLISNSALNSVIQISIKIMLFFFVNLHDHVQLTNSTLQLIIQNVLFKSQ